MSEMEQPYLPCCKHTGAVAYRKKSKQYRCNENSIRQDHATRQQNNAQINKPPAEVFVITVSIFELVPSKYNLSAVKLARFDE